MSLPQKNIPFNLSCDSLLKFLTSSLWFVGCLLISNMCDQCVISVSIQFSSVAQSCPTLCDLMNRSTPGLPSITNSRSLHKLMSIELVMPSSHLILCRPLLLLPPVPPSIRVFSNESTRLMRWPKYWSFSFSISPFNEYSGLISFTIDWFDLLAVIFNNRHVN